MNPSELKAFVLKDMQRFYDEYEIPPLGTTVGIPWSKERIAAELEQMRSCLIDPFLTECSIADTHEQCNAAPRLFAIAG